MKKKLVIISTVLLAVSGCGSLPQDLGRSDVDVLVAERGQPVAEGDITALIASLAEQPLTAQNAIRLALINNPELQSTYAELGVAAADVYEAGRIRNPVFSGAWLDSNRSGDGDQITLSLLTSFTDLLTLSARKRSANAEFAVVKQSVGAAVLETAATAEAAYYRFVAAKQVAALRAQIAKAGALSVTLAQRYRDAGNLTSRELALERAAGSQAKLSAISAEAEAYAARTQLATVLGLPVAAQWDASKGLPIPLNEEDTLADLLVLAQESRLDLAAARARADIVADRLGVTGWTRLLGELEVGVERERETDATRLSGPTVEWTLPIFTQHRDQSLRVDAELQMAVLEVARLKLAVDNDVHLAHAATQNAKSRFVEYRDRLVPARIAATARAQEEENFMLIGIFELLQSKQQEYDTYQGYLEAVRDYWLARTDLAHAVGNTLPSDKHLGDRTLDIEQVIQPKPRAGHSGHGNMNHNTPPDGEQNSDGDSR